LEKIIILLIELILLGQTFISSWLTFTYWQNFYIFIKSVFVWQNRVTITNVNQTQKELHEYKQILSKNRVGIFWTNIYNLLAILFNGKKWKNRGIKAPQKPSYF
jgi:hypothetical protein